MMSAFIMTYSRSELELRVEIYDWPALERVINVFYDRVTY